MKILEIIKKNNISILFFLTLICMTIGFASYNQILNIAGSASLVPGGVISIKSVKTVALINAAATPEIINNNTSIDFNLSFTTIKKENITYEASFDITISNETFEDFVFNMPDYKLDIIREVDGKYESIDPAYAGWKITNADIGDKIPAKSEKTFRIVFNFQNPEESGDITYFINSNFTPSVSNDEDAILMGSVADSGTGDLRGSNESAKFTMKVINTHTVEQIFTIGVKNTDKFAVQNPNNEYTIPANSEKTFEFYLTKVDGVEYPYDSTNVDIIITSQGVSYSTGSVSVLVDQTIIVKDTTAPIISNVSATIENTEGNVILTWEAVDDVTIDNYIIYVYKQNGTTFERVNTIDTKSIEKKYTVSGLAEGTYYFTVTGVDNSGNTATEAEINSATTAQGAASRSESAEYRWNFTVTVSKAEHLSYSGDTTVKRGETCTVTFKADAFYNLPGQLESVTMGGVEYTNVDYKDGVVTIPNVTGDIVIEAAAKEIACLIEGTKILLADGTYKNIEDIEYTDLLAVYDHLNGGITYVYPVWIKEEEIVSVYEKVTFDDGSDIKFTGKHCIYDCEKNEYVDVLNKEEFNLGSKVFKLENNKLKKVTVTKIEYIEEKVKCYDVLSTTNYNVIANGFITTDIITQYANVLYDFDENAVFKNFDKVSNSKQLDYKYATSIPYNIFKGCNLGNILYLIENKGMNVDEVGEFLRSTEKEQISKNGKRHYIVTTSEDKVNKENLDNHLYEENGIYIFPKIGAKYFIDTSTNKKYKEGEKFVVYNSTYFKVVY